MQASDRTKLYRGLCRNIRRWQKRKRMASSVYQNRRRLGTCFRVLWKKAKNILIS